MVATGGGHMTRAEDVPPWERSHRLLQTGVARLEATAALRLDLEILPGVRRDDPALAIIYDHARETHEVLGGLRELQHDLRDACQRDIDERERFRKAIADA